MLKYEAAPIVQTRDTEGPPLDLFSPFGPMIGKTVLSGALVDTINRYCDRIVRPDADSEFLLPAEFVFGQGGDSLGRRIEGLIRRYIGVSDGVVPGRIRIASVWVVSQYRAFAQPRALPQRRHFRCAVSEDPAHRSGGG